MKAATRKLLAPGKWHGGKAYLARRIVALMPEHGIYVEPFAGMLSVLLNKPPAAVEYVSDLNPGLVLFWQVMASAERFPQLLDKLQQYHYDAATFEAAKAFIDHPPWPLDRIDRAAYAANFLAWNRMSRGGLGKDFAWSDRLRGGQPGDLNAWINCLRNLLYVHERVKDLTIWCRPALDMIRDLDSPATLFYCDPPYLHSTRTTRNAYAHELATEEHAELLAVLRQCRGAVLLSGYRSDLYDAALHDWERFEFDMPNHSGQGKTKQRRVECVWRRGGEACDNS